MDTITILGICAGCVVLGLIIGLVIKTVYNRTLGLTKEDYNRAVDLAKEKDGEIAALKEAVELSKNIANEKTAITLEHVARIMGLEKNLEAEKKKYSNLMYQNKSSQVRVGLISEQIAPFLREWPYDPQRFRFIGAPIDGIQITDTDVILLEIKTGRATLSKQQRKIRDMVKAGNVYFETFRIFEDGCQIKREKNNR